MLAENLENLVKRERLEGRYEGRQEGQHEAREETARNLIARTEMNDQMIAEIAGLSMDDIGALRSQPKHSAPDYCWRWHPGAGGSRTRCSDTPEPPA